MEPSIPEEAARADPTPGARSSGLFSTAPGAAGARVPAAPAAGTPPPEPAPTQTLPVTPGDVAVHGPASAVHGPASAVHARLVPAAAAPAAGLAPVRGPLSIASSVTGAVVAGGATLAFSLIAKAIAGYVGYRPAVLALGGTRGRGLVAAAAIGAGIFLAFLWGGYAAGRMARGRGLLHGFLAAVAAGLFTLVGIGAAALLRPGPGLDVSFRLPAGWPHVHLLFSRWLAVAGGVVIAAAGATAGGALGSGWHRRLERQAAVREREQVEARESFRDLRDALSQPEQADTDPPATPAFGSPPPSVPVHLGPGMSG
jgi:hypothetical protein